MQNEKGVFQYELNQEVEIAVSGEQGVIVGRAEYINAKPQYFVRYKAADGRAVESWWSQEAIKINEFKQI